MSKNIINEGNLIVKHL